MDLDMNVTDDFV